MLSTILNSVRALWPPSFLLCFACACADFPDEASRSTRFKNRSEVSLRFDAPYEPLGAEKFGEPVARLFKQANKERALFSWRLRLAMSLSTQDVKQELELFRLKNREFAAFLRALQRTVPGAVDALRDFVARAHRNVASLRLAEEQASPAHCLRLERLLMIYQPPLSEHETRTPVLHDDHHQGDMAVLISHLPPGTYFESVRTGWYPGQQDDNLGEVDRHIDREAQVGSMATISLPIRHFLFPEKVGYVVHREPDRWTRRGRLFTYLGYVSEEGARVRAQTIHPVGSLWDDLDTDIGCVSSCAR